MNHRLPEAAMSLAEPVAGAWRLDSPRLGLAGVIEIIRRRIYVLHPQRLLHVA